MGENVYKNINIEKKEIKVPEFFTKGYQLHYAYHEDWEQIGAILEKYKTKYVIHGPILTINEKMIVKLSDQLTNKLINEKHIQESMSLGITSACDEQKKKLFEMFLRIIPQWLIENHYKDFEKWIVSENGKKTMTKLFSLNGTIKSTEMEVRKILSL